MKGLEFKIQGTETPQIEDEEEALTCHLRGTPHTAVSSVSLIECFESSL